MRIKHVTLLDSGGAYLASRRISDSQQSVGIDSRVTISKSSNQEFSILERVAFKADRNITKKSKIKSDFSIFKSLPFGANHLTDADLVNLHWLPGNLSFPMNSDSKQKFLVTLHDMNYFTGGCHHSFTCEKFSNICSACPNISGLLPQSLIEYSHKRKLRQTTGIACAVAPSRWIKQRAEISSLFFNKEIIHIPNPIAPEFFRAKKEEIRVPSCPIKILILGSNYQNKDSHQVLEIVNQLFERVTTNILLLVIGDKHIGTSIEQRNLANASSESETAKFMSESDVLIYASPADNFPSLILEAQALGVPVIGLDRGGVSETFLDGETGILVKEGISELFHASKSLIQNRLKLESYSRRSQQFAERFSYKVIGERYLNLYENILRGSNAR